jgi:outer membrane protein TolC
VLAFLGPLALVPVRASAQQHADTAAGDRRPRELGDLIEEALERRPDLAASRHAVEATEEGRRGIR